MLEFRTSRPAPVLIGSIAALILLAACEGETRIGGGGSDPSGGADGGTGGDPAATGAGGSGGVAAGGAGVVSNGGGGSGPGGDGGNGAGGYGDTGGQGGDGVPNFPCDGVMNESPAWPQYQVAGDCKIQICFDNITYNYDDDADLPPPPAEDCLASDCFAGTPGLTWASEGVPCSTGVGSCNAEGQCRECLTSADCVGHPGGSFCDSGGMCALCVAAIDCAGTPATPVCDPNQGCVECALNTDCDGNPSGPLCLYNECVECVQDYHCSAAPCGTATCVANACEAMPFPSGTLTGTCFPYACDGISSDCATSCVVDADCGGQSCDNGSCSGNDPCDVEWMVDYVSSCAPFSFSSLADILGVDASGSVYPYQVVNTTGNPARTLLRLSPAGQVLGSFSSLDGLHNQCSYALGPLGGLGINCEYSFSGSVAKSFASLEYNWSHSIGVSGIGSVAAGGGFIDGANNVFWQGSTSLGGMLVATESIVFDIQGNVLPGPTAQVPVAPPQTLPAGFDTTLLSQLATSEYKLDWAGNVTVTGTALGSVDLGGGPLPPIAAIDVIVAKFDSAGQHVWSHRFEAAGASASLVTNEFGATDGSVIVTGDFASADFGWGSLPQLGGDQFVLKIASDGEPVCATTHRGTVRSGPSGEMVVSSTVAPLVVAGVPLGIDHACANVVVARLHP